MREGVRAVKMPSVLAPANLVMFCGFDLVGVIGRAGPQTKMQRPCEHRRVGGRVSSSPLSPLGACPCTAIPAGCPEQGGCPRNAFVP